VSILFSPIKLGARTLKNRIVVSPMCQYSAEDGSATDWHMIHLGHLALSGAGLLFAEATAVSPEGRISAADLGLWSGDNESALGRVVAAIRRYAPSIALGIQLAHAGRKASTDLPWAGGRFVLPEQGGWQTFAPSALPYAPGDAAPLALDAGGLDRVCGEFVAAAQRAERLGFDVIELHAAHGYLLHEFLSPLSNLRDDRYGGSLENRMRFPLEVFDAVRAVVREDIALGVRISATDWVDGGWDVAQSVVLANELQRRGCAFIDVSSGGLSPAQQIPIAPAYQLPFAAQIRAETGLPTIAVGLITEPQQAENIVAGGHADMVALARGMLYDPRWPWHAAAELGAQADAPKQYWAAPPHGLGTLFKPE
jgi:2,4-dienoyl-CoA reductase-like NADH-dependent reductase (Old Yellow Enzyme family)